MSGGVDEEGVERKGGVVDNCTDDDGSHNGGGSVGCMFTLKVMVIAELVFDVARNHLGEQCENSVHGSG